MARSVIRKSYFNANIFCINELPMRFYLEGYDDCQFHEISRIIEAYGGKLSLPDTDTIVFSEPGRYAHTDRRRFHIKCLHDSIVQNKLQDINEYALPRRIDHNHQELSCPKDAKVAPKPDKTPASIAAPILPPKPKKPAPRLPESYVLIRDCAASLPGLLKKQKLSVSHKTQSPNVTEKEQTSIVPSFQCDGTPLLVPAKIAEEPSPLVKSRSSLKTPSTPSSKFPEPSPQKSSGTPSRTSTPHKCPPEIFATPKSAKRSRDTGKSVVEAPAGKDDSFDIIEVPLDPAAQEIIDISDTEYAPGSEVRPENGPGRHAKEPTVPIDWRNLENCDGPHAFAVWSRAGPPGPPNLSDEEGDIAAKKIKLERDILGASPPKTREMMKRISYEECEVDSDDTHSTKMKRRKRRRRRAYEHDKTYGGHEGQPAYTDEENRKMVKYLIDNRAIAKSTGMHVWMKFEVLKILVNPFRRAESLRRHFKDQVIFNFEKYTTDPRALEEFTKIRDKLI